MTWVLDLVQNTVSNARMLMLAIPRVIVGGPLEKNKTGISVTTAMYFSKVGA